LQGAVNICNWYSTQRNIAEDLNVQKRM